MIILSHNLISYLWPASVGSGQNGQQVLQPVVSYIYIYIHNIYIYIHNIYIIYTNNMCNAF